MTIIGVGVFDEHEIFRRGAVACVNEDAGLRVVAQGPSAPDPQELQFDVAVVSPAVLKGRPIACPLVVCGAPGTLTDEVLDAPWVSAAFYRQTLRPEHLVNAIRAAAVGLQVQAVDQQFSAPLDRRGLAVLRLLADGAATREISDQLGYSERTIKGVIHEVEMQLGARSRAHAVALALRKSLI